ncbi:hypothetical protein [Comamonas composti]|uniref:hypothetical protein n=1 Tax=Comamonas composti TaxID=408558 RepID=UPI000415068E|nr:hypothetical protein [Comamonas composti]
MYFMKTPAGQQAFQQRHADLSPRLRSAFLLFNGERSLAQVLESVTGMGVTRDEIMGLVERAWLAPRDAQRDSGTPEGAEARPEQEKTQARPGRAGPLDAAQAAKRYASAYPLAVSLTGALGLKGFRLNLAVEAAVGYEQLAALAPRIRDAVSPELYAPLHKALFEEQEGGK